MEQAVASVATKFAEKPTQLFHREKRHNVVGFSWLQRSVDASMVPEPAEMSYTSREKHHNIGTYWRSDGHTWRGAEAD